LQRLQQARVLSAWPTGRVAFEAGRLTYWSIRTNGPRDQGIEAQVRTILPDSIMAYRHADSVHVVTWRAGSDARGRLRGLPRVADVAASDLSSFESNPDYGDWLARLIERRAAPPERRRDARPSPDARSS
jgi:hypothetical protein